MGTTPREEVRPPLRLNERGRVARGSLEELLQGPPLGWEEPGLNVAATPVTPGLWGRLKEWNGQAITGRLRAFTEAQWAELRQRVAMEQWPSCTTCSSAYSATSA